MNQPVNGIDTLSAPRRVREHELRRELKLFLIDLIRNICSGVGIGARLRSKATQGSISHLRPESKGVFLESRHDIVPSQN